ncbi:MAG TPA: YceI family protein [Patescibacteria group bacterium]|nr:YceI family protein [Patescibacteria group bacterium]
MMRVAALIVLMLAATPAAAADKYSFDPAHTQILFSVSHMGLSHSHGRFAKFDGYFTFDEKNPVAGSVEVTVDMDSVDMGAQDWDEAVRSDKLLDARRFPKMTFKSTSVKKTGAVTGTVTGDLTLHGVIRPLMLEVVFNKAARNPYNKNLNAGFTATGRLKRSDFGMDQYIPDVGDEIAITIEVEGIRQDFEGLDKK